MRFRDVEAKDVPLHENADHIRSLYSQQIMSAASATAYGLIGLLMGFVNKVLIGHILMLFACGDFLSHLMKMVHDFQ